MKNADVFEGSSRFVDKRGVDGFQSIEAFHNLSENGCLAV